MEAIYQLLHPLLGGANLLGTGFETAFGYYVRAGTMTKFEEARVFKLRIGFCYRVRADYQFFGQSANTWKSIAIAENSRFNRMPNLLDYL